MSSCPCSVMENESFTSTTSFADDDQALLERLAKREERRQRRMKEAMERQKEFDPDAGDTNGTPDTSQGEQPSTQRHEEEDKPEQVQQDVANSWRNEDGENKKEEEVRAQQCCF